MTRGRTLHRPARTHCLPRTVTEVHRCAQYGSLIFILRLNSAMRLREFLPPSASYFLFGARGTGKSSLVRQAYPDALYIDFLDPAVMRDYVPPRNA